MYKAFIKTNRNKIELMNMISNQFLESYIELKNGALNPRSSINLSLNDLYAFAGFCFRYLYTFREPKIKVIEKYDTFIWANQRRKYKDYAKGGLFLAFQMIQSLPRGAKISLMRL
jgi:hypothetical protein